MKTKPLTIGSHEIGGKTFTVFAGPCAVESEENFKTIGDFVKKQGAQGLRGGIYKLRTNPESFQGLGEKALPLVKKIKSELGLLFVSEITDPRQRESLEDVVDIFQVGTRNMFNYELLKELGKSTKAVLLKRNFSARIKEWLSAAEYLIKYGNDQVILCERGIRTFETEMRNTLDFNAVVYIKKNTSFPVIVDPSHGSGDRTLISSLAQGAVAVGADGLLLEVHSQPEKALSDGQQSLGLEEFSRFMETLKRILPVFNRELYTSPV
ncbi:MAG: 3-deoxy-7-phosphoheptulonate synthase [Bdellovibrionales bacterium]|nr:3-deoxy-7-phosphoheptulonate synthase [Bdellovibrionales bacterium]